MKNTLLREALRKMIRGGTLTQAEQSAVEAELAQPAEGGEPLFILHCGKIDSSGEQDEWEVEADSHKRVDDFCRLHPGKKIKLYATPPASQDQAQQPGVCTACVMPEQCTVDIAERGPCSGGGQQPSTQAWANETGLRQIECPSCGDLAVAYDPQQPSPATPADMAVYQSIADGYTKAQQLSREGESDAPKSCEGYSQRLDIETLRSDAYLVFDAVNAGQTVRDVIEWYHSSLLAARPGHVVNKKFTLPGDSYGGVALWLGNKQVVFFITEREARDTSDLKVTLERYTKRGVFEMTRDTQG